MVGIGSRRDGRVLDRACCPLTVTGAHKQAVLSPLVSCQSSIDMSQDPQARGESRHLIKKACKMESINSARGTIA